MMNPRRTRRDTKEEERLKSLLREAGTLEYDGTLERPAWAQVRDRLQTAPRRRNVLVPAACTTAALLVMGYGLWVMGFGRKVQQLKGKEQMMALAPQPTTHNLRPPTQNPKPKTQNL